MHSISTLRIGLPFFREGLLGMSGKGKRGRTPTPSNNESNSEGSNANFEGNNGAAAAGAKRQRTPTGTPNNRGHRSRKGGTPEGAVKHKSLHPVVEAKTMRAFRTGVAAAAAGSGGAAAAGAGGGGGSGGSASNISGAATKRHATVKTRKSKNLLAQLAEEREARNFVKKMAAVQLSLEPKPAAASAGGEAAADFGSVSLRGLHLAARARRAAAAPAASAEDPVNALTRRLAAMTFNKNTVNLKALYNARMARKSKKNKTPNSNANI
jgi:hypothetical protein